MPRRRRLRAERRCHEATPHQLDHPGCTRGALCATGDAPPRPAAPTIRTRTPVRKGTPMWTPEPPIALRSPTDLVSLVPYLIGFHPTESLVIVAFTGPNVTFVSRVALPTSPEDADDYRAIICRLTATMVKHGFTSAALVGYGTAQRVEMAVTIATETLTAAHLPVKDAQRVTDGRIFSLTCTNPDCCPAQGTPFDPTSTVTAAYATLAGLVALPDRDAATRQVAPITGPDQEAFAAATRAAAERLHSQLDGAVDLATAGDADLVKTPIGRAVLRHGRRTVAHALDTYRNGRVFDTDPAARLTVLLHMPGIRDFAIARTNAEDWQVCMWTDLLRRVQPPFTPGPAILLAMTALQTGNGPLAACAIRRALDVDRRHRFANLIRRAIEDGIDPRTVATLCHD